MIPTCKYSRVWLKNVEIAIKALLQQCQLKQHRLQANGLRILSLRVFIRLLLKKIAGKGKGIIIQGGKKKVESLVTSRSVAAAQQVEQFTNEPKFQSSNTATTGSGRKEPANTLGYCPKMLKQQYIKVSGSDAIEQCVLDTYSGKQQS